MYLDFYGFRERPFNLTPDPRFVFLSKNHKETFAHILYGIKNRVGFIALTGEVGSGKTTVLRALLSQLDADRHRTALIFNPSLSPTELLQNINREFGLPYDTSNHSNLLGALNQFLLEQNAAGRMVVLVIDEAQNLEPSVLEQIRLISNLETEKEKLIQIILSGQPELAQTLARKDLRQLNQRITVRYHLRPMDFDDVVQYIDHRLEVAGGRGSAVFSKGAVKRIYRYSGGLPRLINVACERALLSGYTRDTTSIHSRIASAAIRDLKKDAMFHFRRRSLILIPVLVVLAILVAGPLSSKLDDVLSYFKPAQPIEAVQEARIPPAPGTGATPQQEDLFQGLPEELGKIPESKSAANAFNALAGSWKASPLGEGSDLTLPNSWERAALDRKLQPYWFSGNLGALLRLDYPAVLDLSLPSVTGSRFLSLAGHDENRLLIDPPLGGKRSFSFDEIEKHWSGRAFLLWKDPFNLVTDTWVGSKGEPARKLQSLLKDAGYLKKPLTGVYDDDTVSAIKDFQMSKGIRADGIIGAQTLMLLYRTAGHFELPTLTTGQK